MMVIAGGLTYSLSFAYNAFHDILRDAFSKVHCRCLYKWLPNYKVHTYLGTCMIGTLRYVTECTCPMYFAAFGNFYIYCHDPGSFWTSNY
jgi:hypothetical protein